MTRSGSLGQRLTGRSIDELDAAVEIQIPGGGTRVRLPDPPLTITAIATTETTGQVPPAQVTAGFGASNWFYAALAVPLAYVGYQEWQKSKKKKTRKKKR